MENKKNLKETGITLVALVITIIILLILAGVAILALTGSGLFNKTEQAKIEYEKAQVKEELELAILSIRTDNLDEFNMDTIKRKLSSEKNLLLDKLEWDTSQQKEQPVGKYKGYNFYINSNYEVIVEYKEQLPDSDEQEEPTKIQRLYYQGNDYREITGGWDYYVNGQIQCSTLENSSYEATYGKYNITQENLEISVIPVQYGGIGSVNEFKTKNKIDLTEYEKIGILGTTEDVTDYKTIGVTNSSTYSYLYNIENKVTFTNNEITYLDISQLTGEYYIQFGMGSYLNGKGNIQEIWLEKKDINSNIKINDNFIKKGENLVAQVEQKCNLDKINLQKSRYILSTQSEKLGVESQEWSNAQSFTNKNQTLQIPIEELGTFYLHVLTVDNSENKLETISEPITVVSEYLYSKNDDCSEITGGWNYYVNGQIKCSTLENSSYEATYGKYSITSENLEISVIPVQYGGIGSVNEFKTKNKIDLTRYTKIGILGAAANMSDGQLLGITNDSNYSLIWNFSNKITFENNEITYLDVSGLTGEYYIQFGMGSYLNGNANIYRIWLE